jgi:hypothetical protein
MAWTGAARAQTNPFNSDADVEIDSSPEPAPSAAPAPNTAPGVPPSAAPAPPPATTAPGTAPAPAPVPAPAPAPEAKRLTLPDPGLELRGYAQMEFQSHADSEDQLVQSSNAPLNQNRFLIRRARLVARRAWEYTSLELELDGNTVSGPSFNLYRAEASVFYRGSKDASDAPWAQLTLGQFRTPFGFELPETPSTRWFMERTQLSRAFFPTEIDVGGRVSGEAGPFRYAAALTNGEPLSEKSGFQLQDPNKAKDFTFSVGAKGSPIDWLHIDGGVSAITGHGFHPGTPATKATLSWTDGNGNGIVDASEILGVGAQAAVKSESFERWALGADLRIEATSPLGSTTLYGEVVAAKNMDRGFFPADPVVSGEDVREFGYYLGFLQELTQYAVVGLRVDHYDPNADATSHQASKTLPLKNTVTTYSPLVGVTLPKRARLVFQYDVIKDYLAHDVQGVPTNLDNDAWTLRLQVNL